jgi:hypothetical protein
MDLLQKYGHLKHDRRKSLAQKEEAEQRHHQTQQGMFLFVLCASFMADADDVAGQRSTSYSGILGSHITIILIGGVVVPGIWRGILRSSRGWSPNMAWGCG